MGVFKWLRRERVTVTSRHNVESEPTVPAPTPAEVSQSVTQVGTIRTEEYKRDLAEFQARRSSGSKEIKELQLTPVKKKCGRHSLPVSCTDCAADHDNTFNYERKSAVKYKKKTHKRVRSATADDRTNDVVPNIQFLFQNQVFMPGNIFETGSYSDPQKSKRHSRQKVFRSPDSDFFIQKHLDFKEEDEEVETPEFFRNNSLPYDVRTFLSPHNMDDVDGSRAAGDLKVSSHSSSGSKDKDDGCEDKLWEVMSELKNFDQWADEQLQLRTPNKTVSDDSKSDTSAYGLPIASASNIDVTTEKDKTWSMGKWGVVPVQVKRLPGVTIELVKKKRNVEVNILRKCRHPNIILLMGLYPDIHDNVQLICERCVDSLYGILHVQGRVLSAQTAVQYALDIANALVFLRMQGYVHTGINSVSVMVTSHGAAKLADLGPCAKLAKPKERTEKSYQVYSPEPQYVNIEDAREMNNPDCEPLLSDRSSETYLALNAASKPYELYRTDQHFRWQAPELFEPDDDGAVHPCSKSDVYSLCLVLWEACNASIPWKSLSYEKLRELYTLWKTGIRLPQDGSYPGCLLALLQSGLRLPRAERADLAALQDTLLTVKSQLEEIEYIIIPARLSKKKSAFSSVGWDTTSPTDSECLSPQQLKVEHRAVVHNDRDSSSSNGSRSDASPIYHTIRKTTTDIYAIPEKCFVSDDEPETILKYQHLPEKDISSACSTPLAKIRARLTHTQTPGTLHRSDSTEYCSILSPNRTTLFGNESAKDRTEERPTTKLSRSFTPQSYKPLHIKVPEFNLDSIRSLLKDQNESERSSYNFDIKNYSLPTTPIARSNKLRKNAWLSGELSANERSTEKLKEECSKSKTEEFNNNQSSLEASFFSKNSSPDKGKQDDTESIRSQDLRMENGKTFESKTCSPESVDATHDSFSDLKRSSTQTSPESMLTRERSNSWSFKPQERPCTKFRVDDDVLASLSVKPLVAIHEKWIYEANRKTGRSMSLPEDNKCQVSAVKPASHCVDTLQQSLPQLNVKRSPKPFRARPASPGLARNGGQWDQFCQNREAIARSMNFSARDPERTRLKSSDKSISAEELKPLTKTDQATDTRSIEEFIRDLIRKEFQHLLHEMADDGAHRGEDLLNKGVANIVESLRNEDPDHSMKKEAVKSFSRVKINGNNKPLLQITFSRSGENSLQVLDNCVNVTICEPSPGKEKLNGSMEDTLVGDDAPALKRCQAFSAIQEARSTEDLYIDDDLSTQMQENFGGKVKLIPLHGSLHEILCEREDECCLIKVKQENGCDTIYFRCDNSDTESRDAIDGADSLDRRDTVVFKRSISLVEERIQRIFPRSQTPRKPKPQKDSIKIRPKSEIFTPTISKESRVLSNSSPSLVTRDDKNDEVEVNIENVMCYQDSSSEECIKCQVENDDFEMLEKKIEEDIANTTLSSLTCGCLEKISEENLSVIHEDTAEKSDY